MASAPPGGGESAAPAGQQPGGPRAWVRSHLPIVAAASMVLVVIIVTVVIVILGATSGGGRSIHAGEIVGTGPLTSGYRLTGTIRHHSQYTVSVRIDRVDTAGQEARNVILRPGAEIELDHPADGTVVIARNKRVVASPAQLHDGDPIVLAGQYTSVDIPPAPAHDGYAYFAIESTAK